MKAGRLRDRCIVLENRAAGVEQDEHGHAKEDWQPLATIPNGAIWAEVQPFTSREFTAAGGIIADVSHKVRTRYIPQLKETMRLHLVKDSRILQIAEPPRRVQQDRNIELEFMCKETNVVA